MSPTHQKNNIIRKKKIKNQKSQMWNNQNCRQNGRRLCFCTIQLLMVRRWLRICFQGLKLFQLFSLEFFVFHYFSKCSAMYVPHKLASTTQNLDVDIHFNRTKKIHPSTHLVLFILERDFEVLSCTDHGLHWSEDVLVDQFGKALFILICVAWPMNYSHLLDEGALPTLSSTLKGNKKTEEVSWQMKQH